MNDIQKAGELRRGVVVLVILAVLTLVEFVIAVTSNLWILLVLIGLIKAAIVIQYYMHLPRAFSDDGGH